jgi:hypothetical protein
MNERSEKMKVTKKAKLVKVIYREVKSYIPLYTCPTCGVEFFGNGPRRNVIRFKCDCGQILEVQKVEEA